MKKNKHTPSFQTRIICTDGSTLDINFLYPKKEISLVTDLLNVSTYIGLKKKKDIHEANKKKKSFDFYSLIK